MFWLQRLALDDNAPYDSWSAGGGGGERDQHAATTCAAEDVTVDHQAASGVLQGDCWRHLCALREAGLAAGWLVPFDELEVRARLAPLSSHF
jgi:hypothetical protein